MACDSDLFRELLLAPDRDRIPGAAPVISVREDEDDEFAEELGRRTSSRIQLSRRGIWHGRWAELNARGILAPEPEPDLRARWRTAKPIVMRGILTDAFGDICDEVEEALTRFETIARTGELERWLSSRLGASSRSGTQFSVERETNRASSATNPGQPDAERDIARARISARFRPKGGAEEHIDDLWVKLGRLSTHDSDASLRVRFSFGREVDDDANSDPVRNRLVAELATRCLPAAAQVRDCGELTRSLDYLAEEAVYPTQQIAYWNAPEGGALFHHDSFSELTSPDGIGNAKVEPRPDRQLGVVFAQVSGRTAWLALSIADLARRVREFAEHLSDGQLPWVRKGVFPGPTDFPDALEIIADDHALMAELAQPGCGRLRALVNCGPEFSSFLADCGHACILRPGDAIVLPNQTPSITTMHSVFCVSPDVTYGISCGLRVLPGGRSPEGVRIGRQQDRRKRRRRRS